MICSSCHDTIEIVETCPSCGAMPVLEGQYRLDELLGSGASGMTFRATHLETGDRVAIKELDWRKLDALKTEELFHREAEVLEQLDHPGIPHYIDTFTVESGRHVAAYLIQEYIDGETLDEEQRSRRYDLDDVLEIAEELLEIVSYLHARTPPVIHRDIKPKNVMRRQAGDLVLIDFGSVRAITEVDGGSTVAGTVGYMAPEQLAGMALPASDVYGVGALIVSLLTRRDPSEFLGIGKGDAWRDAVDVSRPVDELLGMMLAENPADRADDARFVQNWIRELRDDRSGGEWESARQPDETPPLVDPRPSSSPRVATVDSPVPHPPGSQTGKTLFAAAFAIFFLACGVGFFLTDDEYERPTMSTTTRELPVADPDPVGSLPPYGELGDPRSDAPATFSPGEEPDTLVGTVIFNAFAWFCTFDYTGEEPTDTLERFTCHGPALQGVQGRQSPEKMRRFAKHKYGEPFRERAGELIWLERWREMSLEKVVHQGEPRMRIEASIKRGPQ